MKTALNILFFVLCAHSIMAQTVLERQVLGTTGGYATTANFTYMFNVGEAIIGDNHNKTYWLSNGFEQQNYVEYKQLDINVSVQDPTCVGGFDGLIKVNSIEGCIPPYTIVWLDNNDTSTVKTNLPEGEHLLAVTGSTGCTDTFAITLQAVNQTSCELVFYSGFTPNSDGYNDSWQIDFIEYYQPNTVTIANRWQTVVFQTTNYDNASNNWSGNNNQGEQLPNGTYFYVVETQQNKFTGWVEITR